MELSQRQRDILNTVVRTYIQTGEPISSKALMLDFNLSSATLRNELSALCDAGYLEQPHTSAGRIPTVKGYKVYIDDLKHRDTVSGDMKLVIDSMLEGISGEIDNLPLHACQILSELTGLPVLASTVAENGDRVKRIELMPMGRRSLLMVVITASGVVKSRICHCATDLTTLKLARFEQLCNASVVGQKLSVLGKSYSQQLIAAAGDISLMGLTASLFDIIEDISQSRLNLKGESNLFRFYRHDGDVQRLMELIARRDTILSLMSSIDEPVGVLFGNDTNIDELKPATMIVAKYSVDGHDLGRIGVIGPTRMSYERVIPSLEYFASKMSKVITKALIDLED